MGIDELLLHPLMTISPLDGRYFSHVHQIPEVMSEYALNKARVHIEIEWIISLANNEQISDVQPFNSDDVSFLRQISSNFSIANAEEIKSIEQIINHDVKSVEYWIKKKLEARPSMINNVELVHFACTSEDINNLADAIMVTDIRKLMLQKINEVNEYLCHMVTKYAATAMMSRTHGQPASPTTLGKEIGVFVHRLGTFYKRINDLPITAKINGAVGNYHAHAVSYPEVDWIEHSRNFVESLGFSFCLYSTQVESHDTMATLFYFFSQLNNILINLCRDFWGYISLGYLRQKANPKEVGSSTMPHKINPIDFENAESNLNLANSLLCHLSSNLTTSRWQRDLTDSTLKRNISVAFGHCLLGYSMLMRGLQKIDINKKIMMDDLDQNWEVLAEAVQSVMRRNRISNSYEKMKELTRGQKITPDELHAFIRSLPLPSEHIDRLINLSPEKYVGYAEKIAKQVVSDYNR
ncbi:MULTISPECIES: adenylosuccinate lyase [Candidatus Ichthyocystis]|uniref:Adenylosuccinate lyase n=1 Tax=Candidatus Ichthyocystis hellenicum TaxID=1561003 RepID=A0A0S4M100_9BURK|nr:MULTISPECIES: adenylosuccinate lyase [Ichthyocystis]CUT16939.1 Adenylosuccinate lyase [Candidatus Ichthyocystis hellenicum]